MDQFLGLSTFLIIVMAHTHTPLPLQHPAPSCGPSILGDGLPSDEPHTLLLCEEGERLMANWCRIINLESQLLAEVLDGCRESFPCSGSAPASPRWSPSQPFLTILAGALASVTGVAPGTLSSARGP